MFHLIYEIENFQRTKVSLHFRKLLGVIFLILPFFNNVTDKELMANHSDLLILTSYVWLAETCLGSDYVHISW